EKDLMAAAWGEAEEARGGQVVTDAYNGLSIDFNDPTANKVIDDILAKERAKRGGLTKAEELDIRQAVELNIRQAVMNARATGGYFAEGDKELEAIARANLEGFKSEGGYWDPTAISGVGYRDLDTGLTGMREGFSDLYKMTGLEDFSVVGLLSKLLSPKKDQRELDTGKEKKEELRKQDFATVEKRDLTPAIDSQQDRINA
ncbi:MAG TPA: hypothetical protein DCS66_19390, partial [Flavobacteriaceae bacterium]|nr:hypothetical protein [Flavobacteriaceae bacterium]